MSSPIAVLHVLQPKSNKVLVKLSQVTLSTKVSEVKKLVAKERPSLYVDRQSIRLEGGRSPNLGDEVTISTLTLTKVDGVPVLYLKDLGPQIGWTTVFLSEYFGPLVCYLLTYIRPSWLYGGHYGPSAHSVVHIAAACWSVHYIKRLLETIFIHRFSHATMPIMNLVKNCSYYWGFALFVGYYVNHPLYTPPHFGQTQVIFGLVSFLLAELGNLSIHVALRNLRPAGTKERNIPFPVSTNPFTLLFNVVSCPNYTYEIAAWAAFTVMTQAAPAGLFMVAGGYQMTMWALGKHRNYKKEFPNYPKGRKAIIPFLV